jgi:hypothetical protein
VEQLKLCKKKLKNPRIVLNADGSKNKQKIADEYAEVSLTLGKSHREKMEPLIVDIGKSDMLLGINWVEHHNPEVNWKDRKIEFTRCPPSCKPVEIKGVTTSKEEERDSNGLSKGKRPDYIKPYAHLFEKQNFEKLPKRRKWDHAITFTPDAPMEIKAKAYPMTAAEMEILDEFIKKELAAGKIRESKSPYASPCFFIGKKESTDKRLVQDYRKINEVTVKDQTPLPHITELLDTLTEYKYFNKMDIIWGYNNV